MPEGIVTKSVSSFFTVQSESETRVCKARGVFRKRGTQVWVGDRVLFEPVGLTEGVITEVLPRKNMLVRPPVANVEQALLVCSLVHPDFQPGLLDRMLIVTLAAGLQPLIILNKVDLAESALLESTAQPYRTAGYPLLGVAAKTGHGIDAVRRALSHKINVFVGPSGVGKSSLANALSPELALQMGEISEKLGRGKHTTRHVELFELDAHTFVVDAPGFSQLDVVVDPTDLAQHFWEFANASAACAYRGCLHMDEQECAVKEAVEQGQIDGRRYASYVSILSECLEREENRY